MPRPKIFTAEFWARRIDALTDSIRPAARAGANSALLALGQDVTGIDVFQASGATLAGAFAGGVVVWVLTTLAAPPRAA